MTITLVGTATSAGSGNRLFVLPGGWAADDVAIVAFAGGSGGGLITPPAGWTSGLLQLTGGSARVQVFYRRMVGGDTDPTFTYTSSSIAGVMAMYRGVHLTLGPLAFTALSAVGNGPQSMPANWCLHGNVTLIAVGGFMAAPGTPPTLATANGFTSQVTATTTTGSPDAGIRLADKAITNGPTAQDSPTWSGATLSGMIGLIDADQPNLFRAYNQSSTARSRPHTYVPQLDYGPLTSGGSSTYTAVIPPNSLDGDLLILMCFGASGGGTFATPTGWTLEASGRNNTSNRCMIFSKVKAPGEPNVSAAYSSSSWHTIIAAAPIGTTVGMKTKNDFDSGASTASPQKGTDLNDTPNKFARLLAVYMRSFTLNSVASAEGFTQRFLDVDGAAPWYWIGDKPVTDDNQDHVAPSINCSASGGPVSHMIELVGAYQPTRFRAQQGGAGTQAWAHTNFAEAFLGTDFTSSSGNTWTCAIPSNIRPGDVMVLVMALRGSGATLSLTTPGSGWTLKHNIQTNVSSRMYVWTKEYELGDVNPAGTVSSSNVQRVGRIVAFRAAAQYDLSRGDGSTQGLSWASSAVADHPFPNLVGINDTYSTILAVDFREVVPASALKAGSEEGFVALGAAIVSGASSAATLAMAQRRWVGGTDVIGPTFTSAGAGRGMAALIQIEATFQPKNIAAEAIQASDADVVITREQGFPIEAFALQSSTASVRMKTTKPVRKPVRRLVWVLNYDGERIGVVD